jgi:hypothetical protein
MKIFSIMYLIVLSWQIPQKELNPVSKGSTSDYLALQFSKSVKQEQEKLFFTLFGLYEAMLNCPLAVAQILAYKSKNKTKSFNNRFDFLILPSTNICLCMFYDF